MKQEMRKLNRAKYAYSEEEVKRLTSQGFVPVGQQMDKADDNDQAAVQTQAPVGADDKGQAAVQTQAPAGADDKGQAVVQAQVSDGAEQTADSSTQKKRKEAGKK